ncbi:MAG: serine hydrolase [Bacteroidota bacterium]
MNRQALILIVGLLSTLACAQQQDTDRLCARFDQTLSEQFKRDEPGATALVAREGRIVYLKAFGMANLELNVPLQVGTVFKIGSITKQFTAVAILQLAEQGKLHLQDEITRFIPDYPTHGNTITIEHLLTHTSGIRNYSSIRDTAKRGTVDFTPKEMVDYFMNQPMRFAPGTKWEYSNSGYVLLGYIIEIVTGTTYGEYLDENIFKPVGMTNSLYASDSRLVKNRADGYAKSEGGFVNVPYLSMTQPYAAGSILSTVEDLYKWNRAVHSNKLIKKETLQRALTRYRLADGKETNYGYGWRFGYIQESPSIWHGGFINGFIATAMYLPNEDVFVAVVSNCENNSPEDVTAKLAALAIGKPYEYRAMPMDTSVLSRYAGVYENDNAQLRIITAAENRLYSQLGRGPKVNVHACQKDRFFFEDNVFETIVFERSAAGEVEGLVFMSRGGIEVWKKTNKPTPSLDGIKLNEKLLESYIGEYEIRPGFTFSVTNDEGRLFVQATGQDKLEMFAETETKFFLKVNDAQLEFITDDTGNAKKAILRQGGRITDAKKIK